MYMYVRMYMLLCMHVCIYACVYMYVSVCGFMYVCRGLSLCMRVGVGVGTYLYIIFFVHMGYFVMLWGGEGGTVVSVYTCSFVFYVPLSDEFLQ